MAYPRKFKLGEEIAWKEHRSGWGFAMSCLKPLFADQGIYLDTFVEKKFSMDLLDGRVDRVEPYGEPWVGFLHYPPGIPEWHQSACAPQNIFQTEAWTQSLPFCRGLFVFSKWMKDWVEKRLTVPVQVVYHPTETPPILFSWEQYLENPKPSVIQIGWWLRKMRSIHELPVTNLQKVFLDPVAPERQHLVDYAIAQERKFLPSEKLSSNKVICLSYQSNENYDLLLSANIVFLDLYDAVANNAVIECIVRHTPVLVNPLPSVREYLGESYPFYFHSLDEAARKAQDDGCVKEAYDYLKALPKEHLTGDYFLKSIAESELYRSL